MSVESDRLSPEAESAMQMALRVLQGTQMAAGNAVQQNPGFESHFMKMRDGIGVSNDQVTVIHIADRNSIPLSETYVLVMEGLSTYSFAHALGTSFVVDNSRYNRDHDQQYRDAMKAAISSAQTQGLGKIYVLD